MNEETKEQKPPRTIKSLKTPLFIVGVMTILFISIIKNGIKGNDMLEVFIIGVIGAGGICVIGYGIIYFFKLFNYLMKKLLSKRQERKSS